MKELKKLLVEAANFIHAQAKEGGEGGRALSARLRTAADDLNETRIVCSDNTDWV